MAVATRSMKQEEEKDPAHIVSGLRAALDDPTVSKSAKEKAARKLDGCAGTGTEMPEEIEHAARIALAKAVAVNDPCSPGQDNADDMDPVTAYSTYLSLVYEAVEV